MYNPFRMTEINNNIAAVYALNDAVDNIASAIDETGINSIFFRIFHFLNDNLLGRLSRYSAKG